MAAVDCLRRLAEAAGRELTDDEVRGVFERIHQAARDIRSGRVEGGARVGGRVGEQLGGNAEDIITSAAREAAAQLEREAAQIEKQAYLQVARLGARMGDVETIRETGVTPLDAVQFTIERSGSYSGRSKVTSLEQNVAGYQAEYGRRLLETWEALGSDFLGFFQDKQKLLDLVKELRGEDSGNALARRGAEAFHKVAEEARQTFNANGGDIGRLDDWGMPQHHAQEKVAAVGKDAWVEQVLPLLDQEKYVDGLGQRRSEAELRDFLGRAWKTIATNGIANMEPGKAKGVGKRANQHAESRQIHFKDAESYIAYWNDFGDKTAVEILLGHVDTMARDTAFIEHFGPNPNTTYQTLRDQALIDTATANPKDTESAEARALSLDILYNYAAGRLKPTLNRTLRSVSDGIAHLNVAGKLGGAVWASAFGDKPMMEAMSHLNDLPMLQRWATELRLFNPARASDRRQLEQQGLMLDSIRSGLQRFHESLGGSSVTGKIANAVMRMTGMQAVNDIRKGAFGTMLMAGIGKELSRGRRWESLADADARALRHYGITKSDWDTWRLAERQEMAGVSDVLTPESIARIPDAALAGAGIIPADAPAGAGQSARQAAIVKLLGAVNTESDFAIVTPGWKERSLFYGKLQRGTVDGEIIKAVLQFKAFPWTFLQRSMDAVANMDGPVSKAAMISWLLMTTTAAGAMIMQTREVLAGKDPRDMMDKNWWKFWGAAFLQGGALGIYGDFLSGAGQTRHGSGILEAVAGPTLGPLLEMGLVQPIAAGKKMMEGKETHLMQQTVSDLKGFIPMNNVWYTKAATEHLVWHQILNAMNPGYIATMRQRTQRDWNQEWWWTPGELTPRRTPDFEKAIEGR